MKASTIHQAEDRKVSESARGRKKVEEDPDIPLLFKVIKCCKPQWKHIWNDKET